MNVLRTVILNQNWRLRWKLLVLVSLLPNFTECSHHEQARKFLNRISTKGGVAQALERFMNAKETCSIIDQSYQSSPFLSQRDISLGDFEGTLDSKGLPNSAGTLFLPSTREEQVGRDQDKGRKLIKVTGQFSHGQLEGLATLQYDDRALVYGSFSGGILHGPSAEIFEDRLKTGIYLEGSPIGSWWEASLKKEGWWIRNVENVDRIGEIRFILIHAYAVDELKVLLYQDDAFYELSDEVDFIDDDVIPKLKARKDPAELSLVMKLPMPKHLELKSAEKVLTLLLLRKTWLRDTFLPSYKSFIYDRELYDSHVKAEKPIKVTFQL